jgi:hypothetical protein
LASCDIQELNRAAALFSRKVSIASRVAAKTLHHEEVRDKETLCLIQDNERSRKENEALKELQPLYQEKIQCLETKAKDYEALFEKMRGTIEENEKILENLRREVEKGTNKKASLSNQVKLLQAEGKKKDETIGNLCSQVTRDEEIVNSIHERSELIYKEYKATLATFGAELLPLPVPDDTDVAEKGIEVLCSWLLNEFSGLKDAIATASGNSAVVTCESVISIPDREGCSDIKKLCSKDYSYPTYDELGSNIVRVQAAKKMFLRRFQKVSGREAVQAIAASRLEKA